MPDSKSTEQSCYEVAAEPGKGEREESTQATVELQDLPLESVRDND